MCKVQDRIQELRAKVDAIRTAGEERLTKIHNSASDNWDIARSTVHAYDKLSAELDSVLNSIVSIEEAFTNRQEENVANNNLLIVHKLLNDVDFDFKIEASKLEERADIHNANN